MIQFSCPKCDLILSVPDSTIGQPETSPRCGNVAIVLDTDSTLPSEKEDKKTIRIGFAGDDDPANAWVFAGMALGGVIGGFIGAGSIEPALCGVIIGGGIGALLGALVGLTIAFASKSKRSR